MSKKLRKVLLGFETFKAVLEKFIWLFLGLLLYGIIADGKDIITDPKANILYGISIVGLMTTMILLWYNLNFSKKEIDKL